MRGVDSYLAIKPQVDFNTARTIGDLVSGDYLTFNSESLSGAQQVFSNPAIRRQAMQARAFSANGTMDAGGNIEFTGTNFTLDTLLPLIFHSKTGTADGATGEGAVYTLTDGGVLTPFTTFVGFDGPEGVYTRLFAGCKVNTASFSARIDDMLRLNLGLSAVNKTIVDAVGTPSYPSGDVEYPFIYDQASVWLKSGDMANLVEVPVESFDLNINHNLDTGAYRLGSAYRRSLQEGVTAVDGTITLDAATRGVNGEVLDLDDSVVAHDPAFFEKVAREARYAAIRLQFIDTSDLVSDSGSSTSTNDEYGRIVIDLPFTRIEEPNFNVSQAGRISGSLRFVGYDSMTVTHLGSLS